MTSKERTSGTSNTRKDRAPHSPPCSPLRGTHSNPDPAFECAACPSLLLPVCCNTTRHFLCLLPLSRSSAWSLSGSPDGRRAAEKRERERREKEERIVKKKGERGKEYRDDRDEKTVRKSSGARTAAGKDSAEEKGERGECEQRGERGIER